jgi:ribose transport system permease protein
MGIEQYPIAAFREKSGIRRIFYFLQTKSQRQMVLIGAIAALGTIFSLTSRDFLTPLNLWNIVTQSTPILIIAFGMTVLIISGGIDLSVGSVASFVGVISVRLMINTGISFPVALLVGLMVGATIGIINGVSVAFLGIPAFIATLAMMSIARGTAFIISGGFAMRIRNDGLAFLYNGNLATLRFPVILTVAICLVIYFLLTQTRLGRSFYALGGNDQASRLCGLNTRAITVLVFAITGLCTGLSGMITSSRMAAGSPTIGMGWELQAIAIVIFGGANLLGGEGSISGTLLAGVLIGMINNWMSLTGLDWWLQGMVQGFLLILVVTINQRAISKQIEQIERHRKQFLRSMSQFRQTAGPRSEQ